LASQDSFVSLELVVDPFEEQHTKDVFLELRRIHVATQDVAGFEENALKAWEGEFLPAAIRRKISV
jgi:hypothetical protein